MNYDLVIFDCDGVLVDSEVIVIQIEAELLSDAGFSITADEIADRFVGLSYPDMMAQLQADFGRAVPESLTEQIHRDALAAFPTQLQPVEGMHAFLEQLTVPRCVASSSDLDRVMLSLDVTGLAEFFEPSAVFSAQMVEHGKPAPDLFLHAAQQCGASPDRCLVIEDSPHGVAAAIAAGMDVVALTAGKHCRPSLIDRLRNAGATVILDNPLDIDA